MSKVDSYRRLVYALFLALAAATATGAEGDGSGMQGFVGVTNVTNDLRPFFIITMRGIWPTHNVEVCWERHGGAFAKERALARAAVSKFIEGNSQYRFGKAWAECDADQRPRIRIEIADAGPRSDIGYQTADGALFGPPAAFPTFMRLNFEFSNWGTGQCTKTEATKRECIRTVAVHEFLHALGAIHEQLSEDLEKKDPSCWEKYAAIPDLHPTDARALTDYDPDSIMNYCREIYSAPTRLSNRDLSGLTALSALTAKKMQK